MTDRLKSARTRINDHKSAAVDLMDKIEGFYSGELILSTGLIPFGMSRASGRIKQFDMSVNASGKDDSAQLAVSGEVFINGISALTTVARIGHVSGEASQQKTTNSIAGDASVTQAVVDQTANSFNPGDVFTYALTLDRTSSPTTEISNIVVLLEFDPNK